MLNKKISVIAVFVIIVTMVFSGCQSSQDTNAPEQSSNENKTDLSTPENTQQSSADTAEEKTIRFSISSEPPTMDPQIKTASNMASVATHIFEGLVRVFDGEIKPGMAQSWDISEDGLVYTFKIRDDAKWSDGIELTAKDFEYAFIRILDPNVGSEFAYLAYDIVNGEEFNSGKITDASQVGVKALDDKTLEIKLKNPVSYFLSYMDFTLFSPSRQDLVEKHGAAYGSDADKVGCNGPYILEDWTHESSLTLVKNPNYWDAGSITTDKIEVYIVLDSNTGMAMYETGDLDIVDIPKDRIKEFQDAGTAKDFSDGGEYFIMANNKGATEETGKLLNNPNFVKAIGFAIDRQLFIDAVLKNSSKPALRYGMPLLNILNNDDGKQVNYCETYPLNFYTPNADLEKANEYLNKALEEVNMTKDQMPVLSYVSSDTEAQKLSAEALQDMLRKNLGIETEIRQVQYKQYLELINQREYDLCLYGWGPDFDDPMTYMDLWMMKPGGNMANWENQAYTDYITFAKTTTNLKERAEAIYNAEKLLLDEGPIIPIYVKYTAYAMNDRISNIDRPFIGGQPKCMYAEFK